MGWWLPEAGGGAEMCWCLIGMELAALQDEKFCGWMVVTVAQRQCVDHH